MGEVVIDIPKQHLIVKLIGASHRELMLEPGRVAMHAVCQRGFDAH